MPPFSSLRDVMQLRVILLIAVILALVLTLVSMRPASAAHGQYDKFPTGQGQSSQAWDVKHHKNSPDAFRYLLVACGGTGDYRYRVRQDRVDPCGKRGVIAYHIPSSCEDNRGNVGPRWINTKGDEFVVSMKGRYCAS